MGARMAVLLAACLALLAPAAAQDGGPAPLAERCAPPCGYILPILDIEVEDKQPCGGGRLIYAQGPPEDCEDIVADGASRAFDAKVLWYWEMSEDGTYPKEAGEDIVISFSGTATNPSWLQVEVTGEGMTDDGTYVIGDADLFDPNNFRVKQNSQDQQSMWFWFERDITITFTRAGGPTGSDVDRIENREGVQVFFLKGMSTSSGARFKEAFGVEEFRFNTCADDAIARLVRACGGDAEAAGDERVPGLPAVAGLAAVAALARLRRRR